MSFDEASTTGSLRVLVWQIWPSFPPSLWQDWCSRSGPGLTAAKGLVTVKRIHLSIRVLQLWWHLSRCPLLPAMCSDDVARTVGSGEGEPGWVGHLLKHCDLFTDVDVAAHSAGDVRIFVVFLHCQPQSVLTALGGNSSFILGTVRKPAVLVRELFLLMWLLTAQTSGMSDIFSAAIGMWFCLWWAAFFWPVGKNCARAGKNRSGNKGAVSTKFGWVALSFLRAWFYWQHSKFVDTSSALHREVTALHKGLNLLPCVKKLRLLKGLDFDCPCSKMIVRSAWSAMDFFLLLVVWYQAGLLDCLEQGWPGEMDKRDRRPRISLKRESLSSGPWKVCMRWCDLGAEIQSWLFKCEN